MARESVGDKILMSWIETKPAYAKLTASEIIELKKAGVSETVIAAMINHPTDTEPVIEHKIVEQKVVKQQETIIVPQETSRTVVYEEPKTVVYERPTVVYEQPVVVPAPAYYYSPYYYPSVYVGYYHGWGHRGWGYPVRYGHPGYGHPVRHGGHFSLGVGFGAHF
jgi:hypothetical protein